MAKKGQTVTRYSQNPLAKKFKCDECGNWYRTLQGLSGHVRFKHGAGSGSDDLISRLSDVMGRKIRLATIARSAGVQEADIQARLGILDEWAKLIGYCESFGVKPSAQDYKNYVIQSYYARLG